MWYVELFLHELTSRGCSASYIASNRLHVERFIKWCSMQGITSVKNVSDAAVNRYFESTVENSEISPGWKYAKKLVVRRYFAFLEDRNLIFVSPQFPIRKPEVPSGHYQALKLDELRWILDEYPTDTDADLLVKSILETGYSAALRPCEIRHLMIEDIDYRNGRIFIEQSKGKKDRVVPVGAAALHWMQRYLSDARPHYAIDPADRHVYLGPRSKRPFGHTAIGEFVGYRLEKYGFSRVCLHQLRASAATHMVESGMDIAYVQQILGHTELNTTRNYVQLDDRELARKLAGTHPRNAMAERRNGI
jgi:integrase/recombinase XerD